MMKKQNPAKKGEITPRPCLPAGRLAPKKREPKEYKKIIARTSPFFERGIEGDFIKQTKQETMHNDFTPKFFLYNGNLKDRARKMRNNPTDAEKKLWNIIRQGDLANYKFLRQKIIGNYIADFYCSQYKLILEVDGGGHDEIEQIEYDKERTLFFENLEIKVLRFWNNDVLGNPEGVYKKVLEFFKTKSPSVPLSKKRED